MYYEGAHRDKHQPKTQK